MTKIHIDDYNFIYMSKDLIQVVLIMDYSILPLCVVIMVIWTAKRIQMWLQLDLFLSQAPWFINEFSFA